MKLFYRKIITSLFSFIKFINLSKVFLFEWIEIYRKREIYNNIQWSNEQQKEFDEYWKESYGKKISNRWHKLYQAFNGEYNKEYIPEWIYSVKIEPKLNPFLKSKILEDKSLCEVILDSSDNITYSFPETILVRAGEYFYDKRRNIISLDDAHSILSETKSAIIKPTIGGSSGNGVQLLDNDGLVDAIFNNNDYHNAIVQEKIIPSDELSLLNSSSINTFRIITYLCNGNIFHSPICLRIGGGDSILDNIHAGGMVIHVSDDGCLSKYAYSLGWGDTNKKFDRHPNTNIIFDNYKIKNINKVILAAYEGHGKLSGIGIISWDITLDINNMPVVIETNLLGQSAWFPQIISGKSLFGDNTKEMLKSIFGNKNE
ncbi:TPA: sugar-transfer associated ATP-grasp domain-containing protein [Photobacterium damselae]